MNVKINIKIYNGVFVISSRQLYSFLTDKSGDKVTQWLSHCSNKGKENKDYYLVSTGGFRDCLLTLEYSRWLCQGWEKQGEVESILSRIPSVDEIQSEGYSDDTSVDLAGAAKLLGYSPLKLFEILRKRRVITMKNLPYQYFLNNGFFKVKKKKYVSNGKSYLSVKTVVTETGIEYLKKILQLETLAV